MKTKALVMLVLAITILGFSVTLTPSYAEENAPQTYLDARYNYTYTEVTDENHVTTRVYDAKSQPKSNSSTYGLVNKAAKTKSILSSLGMGEDFIDALSAEDLENYAASESITSTVAYTQTDSEGNVINISEEDAEAAVAAIGPGESMIQFPGSGESPDPVEENEGTYDVGFGTLKLVFIVSYWGDALYRFSVDSEWLTMPGMRGYDSLGACAQYMSLPGESDDAKGWVSYRSETYSNGETTESNEREDIPSENFERPTTDGWNGVAGVFNLPNDVKIDEPGYYYYLYNYDFKAHVQFNIEVAFPDFSANIDPRATYSHSSIGLEANLGIYIGIGDIGPEIGVGVVAVCNNRTIRLPNGLSYTPED